MRYTPRVKEHFMRPRNAGALEDANGVGIVGDPACGDSLKVYIRVEHDRIDDISFECKGCPAAIATASVMTAMVKGRDLDSACEVGPEQIVDALGGLPEGKEHCSNLAASGLEAAIMDHILRFANARRDR